MVLLNSSCHDFHVIMAVAWKKTRWKTTSAKNHHRRKEGLWLSVVVSAATGQPLV
jgi:hypothetical protein